MRLSPRRNKPPATILPQSGKVFISVRDADKPSAVSIAQELIRQGFVIVATRGTTAALQAGGLSCELVNKVVEGRPHIADMIKNDEIVLIINTTEGKQAIADSFSIRREALMHKVYYTTTIAGARATCLALSTPPNGQVNRLQDLHRELLK